MELNSWDVDDDTPYFYSTLRSRSDATQPRPHYPDNSNNSLARSNSSDITSSLEARPESSDDDILPSKTGLRAPADKRGAHATRHDFRDLHNLVSTTPRPSSPLEAAVSAPRRSSQHSSPSNVNESGSRKQIRFAAEEPTAIPDDMEDGLMSSASTRATTTATKRRLLDSDSNNEISVPRRLGFDLDETTSFRPLAKRSKIILPSDIIRPENTESKPSRLRRPISKKDSEEKSEKREKSEKKEEEGIINLVSPEKTKKRTLRSSKRDEEKRNHNEEKRSQKEERERRTIRFDDETHEETGMNSVHSDALLARQMFLADRDREPRPRHMLHHSHMRRSYPVTFPPTANPPMPSSYPVHPYFGSTHGYTFVPPMMPFLSEPSASLSDEDLARRMQEAENERARALNARAVDFDPTPGLFRSLLMGRGGGGPHRSNVNPALLRLSLMNRELDENDYEMLLKLDESVENKKGATDNLIDTLPVQVVKKAKEVTQCVICLMDMEIGSEIRTLPCSHYFHTQCIDQWLKVNKCCPIDKKSIERT